MEPLELSRRELLELVLGSSAAWLAGCARPVAPPQGELLAPSFRVGHRIRDGRIAEDEVTAWHDVPTVIVGAGISGLVAAWRLQHGGHEDFRILELEPVAGGTSRSDRNSLTGFPWGAHYLPAPLVSNAGLCRLLDEMDLIERFQDDGTPVITESGLCRDPEERVWVDGEWIEGLYPARGATEDDLRQLSRFHEIVDEWVAWRDASGRPAFALPVASSSTDRLAAQLDQLSVAEWLDQQEFRSPRLRWLLDYCCRDDYGLTAGQTSAWAGLFYFCSRVRNTSREPQPLVTWPEGNGRFVNYLAGLAGDRLRTQQAVLSLRPDEAEGRAFVSVVVQDLIHDRLYGLRADRVICAAPQFVSRRLIRGFPPERDAAAASFEYGSWVVANLHLRRRPAEYGFPPSWDNVIAGSRSLGYVCATHQTGNDHGPTVWTWYSPLCDERPDVHRQQLLDLPWEQWADVVLTDLRQAHPDIEECVERLDIMRWGHAMVSPRPGFITSPQREMAARPWRGIHFAGTDLSGMALFEEAFFHGVRSAEEVLDSRQLPVESFL